MNCLYCDEEIKKVTLTSLLLEDDLLCPTCRKQMKKAHQFLNLEGLEVEVFYDYDSLFRTLLLQYKECYDEALKDVFLYGIQDYLRLKYHGYSILYVPSTKKKEEERGFSHLKEIYGCLGLKEVEGVTLIEERIQEKGSRKEREKMKKNYRYTGALLDKVLIVDDVVTTGSSLIGVYNAIKPSAKRVKAVSLGIKIPR